MRVLEDFIGKEGVKTYKCLCHLNDNSQRAHERAEFCPFRGVRGTKHLAAGSD